MYGVIFEKRPDITHNTGARLGEAQQRIHQALSMVPVTQAPVKLAPLV